VKNRKALSVYAPEDYRGPWLLSLPGGAGQSFDRANDFIAALSKAMTDTTDIEQLFALWERNVDTVRAINRYSNHSTPRSVIAQNLVAHLKSRAIALANKGSNQRPIVPRVRAASPAQKLIRVSSRSVRSVFAQKRTFALSPRNHASFAAVPRRTLIISATRNREGLHSK
jgi:hypothetical protein